MPGILPDMITREFFPSGAYVSSLTQRQVQTYGLADLIDATRRDDDKRLGFYREISSAIASETGASPSSLRSYFLPTNYVTRDMTAAGVSGSNYLVGSPVAGFASGLFANSLIGTLPLRVVPMQGNGSITASTTSPTVTWLADEGTEIADASMALGSRSLVAKTVSVTATISHTMGKMADSAAPQIEQQLGARLGEASGTALVDGAGNSGQPLGLLRIANTTSTSGSNLAASGIRDLLAAAEGYSANGLRFVLGTTAAKLLRSREVASGAGLLLANGMIFGYPAIVSRCMPADALLLADFSRVTWASWGAIEAVVSPLASSAGFRVGSIGVRLMWTMDFAADHASIIGKSTSIT